MRARRDGAPGPSGPSGPGGDAVVVIKLHTGWRLFDGRWLRSQACSLQPTLPPGAWLAAALPLSDQGQLWPAECELARFVHLHLGPGSAMDAALALARGWVFVERAEAAS